jgi:hypothetical protein
MKKSLRKVMIPVIPFAMISLVMVMGFAASQAENSDASKAIFYVG